MHDLRSCRLVACFGVAASVVGLVGCGRGERARLEIEGTVTYDGAPLPAGVIRFEPNPAKGSHGPVGIAAIVNGSYSTAAPGCQGAVPGPLVAVISGFPAAKPKIEYQAPLFSEWRAEVELASAGRRPTRLDFTVPKQGQPTGFRYVLPSHKVANWVGPGRSRKSTQPSAGVVVELPPFELLDRLADLVLPPRKHRYRYRGVFNPHHTVRWAVTALAVGNIGKRRDAATGEHGNDGHGIAGCCAANQRPRSRNTSRIAQAKLMARVGEGFPLQCPGCGGDIRLIAFITEPDLIQRILTLVCPEFYFSERNA